jgi:hypothetical protein
MYRLWLEHYAESRIMPSPVFGSLSLKVASVRESA